MKKIEVILKYLENEGISLSRFEQKSGLGASYLSKTRDRGVDISNKVLEIIKNKNPVDYFKIFPNEINISDETRNLTEDPGQVYIKIDPQIQRYIDLLEKHNAFLEEQLQSSIKKLESNFETSLKNQAELLAQLKAGIYAAARRYAGSDKKKLQAEMEYIYNTAGVALSQNPYNDNTGGS